MSKRASEHSIISFRSPSCLLLSNAPPPMLPSGRGGTGRGLLQITGIREPCLPPSHQKRTPTGRAGGAVSPSLYKTLCQGSPLSPPHHPAGPLRADSGILRRVSPLLPLSGRFGSGRGRKGRMEFFSSSWGEAIPCPSPHSRGTSERPRSASLPDRPSPSPVPPLWLPGLETFFGKQHPPRLLSPGDEEEVGHTKEGQAGSPVLGT